VKLRTRFTLAALVLAESALLSALALQHGLEKQHLERKQSAEQESSLKRLARVAQDASLEQNEVFLLNYLKVLKDSPEIRYAAFVEENGRIRVHTAMFEGAPIIGLPWNGPPQPGGGQRQIRVLSKDGREIHDWSLAILRGENPIGSVHLGFDAAVLRQSVKADLSESRKPLLWEALILSLLAWLAAAWLARGLTAPLSALHEGARKIGAGELDFRIDLPRADELGDLSEGFNRMAGELERINKFKEQLMASITHDLRSPLSAISGHAEILLSDSEATQDERRESAELIRENARRMEAMANDMTDLVKLQLGRLEAAREPVRMEEAFASVKRLLDVIAKRLDVVIDVETPRELPSVVADPSHLHRILTNLVSNALKFTPSGGRIVLTAAAESHHVRVVVSDTGTGIAERKVKTLFTRFTGMEGVKHGQPDLGTGLGLSICREFVEMYGGKIWAESELKKGTRVFFTLPLGDKPCSDAC
jgi:histidine kinase